MRRSTGRLITFVALLLGVTSVCAAPANAETATSFMDIQERGPLFKSAFEPVDVHLEVKVIPDPGSASVSELSKTRLNLPKDLTFSTRGTPVCTKDIGQVNPQNANRPTEAIIAECPNSVVGGGTAVINVAGLTAPSATISDPILTVFNGGDDEEGNPVLLIHGFSASVLPGGYGVPMSGALKDGVLEVSVPPLAVHSSVTAFTFDLPGVGGRDPDYVQTKCSTGVWRGNAVLTLHDFNNNTGDYDNVQELVTADTVQSCEGKEGTARIAPLKIKGPKSVKAGKKGVYAVTVKNTGEGRATGVKISAIGKGASGRANGGNIAAGSAKKLKVKVKFTKRGTSKVKFKVTAKGAKPKTKAFKVKVK